MIKISPDMTNKPMINPILEPIKFLEEIPLIKGT